MLRATRIALILFVFGPQILANVRNEIVALVPGSSNNKEFACMVKGIIEEKVIPNSKIKTFDNQNDPMVTGKLVKDTVKAGQKSLIGTISSQEALAAVANMTQDQTLIVPLASHPKVTDSGKSVISMVASSERYAKLFGSYIERNHKRNDQILIVNNLSKPYSVFYAEEMNQILSARGFTVLEFPINDGFANFDLLVEKVIRGKFAIVYMPIYTSEATKIYSLLTAKNFNGIIYSQGAINDGREFFESLKGPTIIFNSIWNEKYSGPNIALFKKIRNDYCQGTVESVRQVYAFDAFIFLRDYLNKNGVFDFEIAKKSKFQGLPGTITFDHKGNAIRNLNLFKISNGKTKFLTEVSE